MTIKQASPQGITWFQDARFGMFIHWGLYSILARQEWVMHIERIPVPEYEKLMHRFNPTRFNADEWVGIAADAGQKYIVITSRHHDGFSMYDTALSDYKVTRTPFKRDPLAELADACARRGDIKLGFYVSLLDWHHPAYRFREESGLAWSDYLDFLHGQVRELCTNFGPIACIWLDGDWPRHSLDAHNAYFAPGGSFEYEKLYDMIHTLQPDAVIHNNRHAQPLPGEDVQGFEQDLPGENTAGFNETHIFDLPIEVCMTINDHWGYCMDDDNHKSVHTLIHKLVRSAACGGNYLLNVGPTAEGVILPVQAKRLRAMGAWLAANGESIYATRKGAIPATPDVVSTRRGDTHYLHVLNYVSDEVYVPGVPHTAQATLLRDGAPVRVKPAKDGIRLVLPEEARDPFDTVVKLHM
ncbi:MAG: alpha-L-fucosidase [Candidatus Thermofonsia Clade 3 bacterium]|uniref:alpha-L-fucosidase n=1 Tax=Candidatus Thermofonsia Clade 3 bacterium TaxID=2364212 RepID=A0A2M8QAH1_9CHLR|nr:MAG: alpha-L-fucosidase [Candidatus Thermofonsia Clade 3 bacterium]